MQGKSPFNTLTDAATIAVDFSISNSHFVTLGGSRTLTFSNPQSGEIYCLKVTQDATGSRTLTFPSTVKWAGGSAPTLTTTASRTDFIYFMYDGTSYVDVSIKLNHTLP
jgi:hypothetical protein